MTIPSINPAAVNPLTAASAQQTSGVPPYVQTAAKALGMDTTSVMAALQSGKSLADLAQQQGVSVDDLTSALKAAAPQGAQDPSRLDQMTARLVNHRGVVGHHGHGGHRAENATQGTGLLTGTLTSDQQATLSTLSGLLGTDPGSLLTQLQSGADLGDLLQQNGVSLDALSSSLQKGLLIDAQG